ncbi:MAG: TraB/GumN family protein [Rhizobiales bacterium]|nr:TraB/GumN family protein [Hyphomicrobiales bacterium]
MKWRCPIGSIVAAGLLLTWSALPSLAEASVCTGNDLIADMRAHDAATYAALRVEADAIPTNHGLLWKIEPPSGAAPSYLFGTVHVTDPRVHALRPSVQAALDNASTIIVESTEALTTDEVAKHMFKVARLLVLPGTQTLDDVIPAAELARVKAFYDKEDGYEAHFKYRPYMLAIALSFAPCELARQKQGFPSLDSAIAATAGKSQAKLVGLETMVEQFTAMSDMPMPQQVDMLMQAIELRPQIDDYKEALIRLYLAQETGLLLAWSRATTVEHGDQATWDSFKNLLIDTRNKRMAERALPVLDGGNAFMAVGALHLPGETGLVNLLRARGYKVTAID